MVPTLDAQEPAFQPGAPWQRGSSVRPYPLGCSATCGGPRTSCHSATISYPSLVKCLVILDDGGCKLVIKMEIYTRTISLSTKSSSVTRVSRPHRSPIWVGGETADG